MGFQLSKKSLSRLDGVHNDLVVVVHRAIELTEIDFGVAEGLRSLERQQALVDHGDSWTLDSRHLTGHAVDLVAYVGGKPSWNWSHYFKIAEAMKKAAAEEGIPLIWGGLWDKELTGTYRDLEVLQAEYIRSFRQWKGRAPNIDGPHFELPRRKYPAPVPA